MIHYSDFLPGGAKPGTGENPERVPSMDLERRQQDQSYDFYLRDAIEELDVLAGDVLAISQRATHAATKRGDEIDAILAGIRDISLGLTSSPE